MGTESQHRRGVIAALGVGMFLLFLALTAVNAFNPLPPFCAPTALARSSCLPRFP